MLNRFAAAGKNAGSQIYSVVWFIIPAAQ